MINTKDTFKSDRPRSVCVTILYETKNVFLTIMM